MYFKILAKKRHGIVKLNIKYNILEKTISLGTSMYYVSTKGGGRGSAKCLRLLRDNP